MATKTKTSKTPKNLDAAAPELFKLVLEMVDEMVLADDAGRPRAISSTWKLRAMLAIEKAREGED